MMSPAMAHYVRSHGLGNDYIVIDPRRVPFAVTPEAARLICDRHRGVGSDGILLVDEPHGADFGVRILNPDGSEAEKSGNGIRIFAKYLREHGYTTAGRFDYDRASGPDARVNLDHESIPAVVNEALVYVVARDLRGGEAVAGPFRVAVTH